MLTACSARPVSGAAHAKRCAVLRKQSHESGFAPLVAIAATELRTVQGTCIIFAYMLYGVWRLLFLPQPASPL